MSRRYAGVIKHPDWVVEAARQLKEDHGWGYKRIAKKLEVPRSTVKWWCQYRGRV